MAAVPALIPVTYPEVVTLATPILLLLQLPPEFVFPRVCVVPWQNKDAPEMPANGLTVTTKTALHPVPRV
jgi:hypothetical protein